MPRLTLLAAAALALGSLAPSPAHAAFDVVPYGCDARATPWQSLTVFSTRNPNPESTFVDYGNENLMLASPNFREGQPTEFAPGFSEGLFATSTPGTEDFWYLQGALAGPRDAACEGPDSPRNTVAPRIVGDPVAGGTVTLDPGTWEGAGPLRRFAWVEACDDGVCLPLARIGASPGSGAPDLTGPTTFAVGPSQVGSRLRLAVAGYSWRGVSTAASALSAPVTGTPPQSAPTFSTTSPPPLEVVGNTLAAPARIVDLRYWDGTAQPDFAFQWQRCSETCELIPGATGPLHTLVPADVGHELRLTFTASNAAGSVSGATTLTGVSEAMLSARSGAFAVDLPTLAGSPQAGRPLHVDAGTWIDDGRPHGYTWQRCADTCVDIPGAVGATYTPTRADVGSGLRSIVEATGTVGSWSGHPASVTVATDTSEPVLAAAPVDPPPPTQDRTPPRLSQLSLRPSHIGAEGTTLRLTTSERASLRLQVRRADHPRRVLAQTRRTLAAGRNHLHLGRRLGGVTLTPGRYTLTLVATDADGNRSAPRVLRFRVPR